MSGVKAQSKDGLLVLHPRVASRVTRGYLHILMALRIAAAAGCIQESKYKNVEPGDADYPVVNPHPVDNIDLKVIIPATIAVRLFQGYHSQVGGGSVERGHRCESVQTFTQIRSNYYVEPPLELTQTGPDVLSGQFIVDRYLPGQCDWGFAGAWYGIINGAPARAVLLVNKSRVDIWCIHSRKRDPKLPVACSDILDLRSQFSEEVSAETTESIVAAGKKVAPLLDHAPGIRDLVIQFHDLNAAGQDLALRVN
jgi:hypothetical protein